MIAAARAPDEPPRDRVVPAGFHALRAESARVVVAFRLAVHRLALHRRATADVSAEPNPPPAAGGQGNPRLERIGTPLLLIGAAALAGALARLGLHLAGRSGVAGMLELRSFRDAGLIVRHAYHFPSGHLKPLYRWIPRGGTNLFIYPPFAAATFAAVSYLSPLALAWCVTAASLAALFTAVRLTLAGAGVPKSRARTGAALAVSAVALWTQPVMSALGLGHLSLVLMAAVIWDLRPRPGIERAASQRVARGRGRASAWWTGALTGGAAGITLTPLIFIPYLLVTRKFRQAAVAAGAFAVTVGIGFAVMPGSSAGYWQPGLIERANGAPHSPAAFFFAAAWNQSLRGYLTRLAGQAPAAFVPWLIAAALTAGIGLMCAALLHHDGYPMLGVLACALAGLLISPVSWAHHWVWVAPWLAAITAMALLAPGSSRRMWIAIAAWITLVFVNWPPLPILTGARHGMNVVADVPVKQPFTWIGLQVFAGNSYLFCGAAGLVALYAWCFVRALRRSGVLASFRPRGAAPWTGQDVEVIPGPMSYHE